jgi:hypothetical protein
VECRGIAVALAVKVGDFMLAFEVKDVNWFGCFLEMLVVCSPLVSIEFAVIVEDKELGS